MSEATQQVFEYRGVDMFHVARITKDDATGYETETPVYWSPVQEIGKTTEASNEAHYYDNKAMIVVSSESADTVSIIMAPPELRKLAIMVGKSFDEETGMMVDGERNNDYFAISYRTKGTDGKYRYVVRQKGTFSIPEEQNQTENDGTDTTNTSIEFTGIFTTYEFEKGKKVDGVWVKGGVKGIIVDERYAKTDLTKFFEATQTPDTIKPKDAASGDEPEAGDETT